jgi:hypothetical protein
MSAPEDHAAAIKEALNAGNTIQAVKGFVSVILLVAVVVVCQFLC